PAGRGVEGCARGTRPLSGAIAIRRKLATAVPGSAPTRIVWNRPTNSTKPTVVTLVRRYAAAGRGRGACGGPASAHAGAMRYLSPVGCGPRGRLVRSEPPGQVVPPGSLVPHSHVDGGRCCSSVRDDHLRGRRLRCDDDRSVLGGAEPCLAEHDAQRPESDCYAIAVVQLGTIAEEGQVGRRADRRARDLVQ